ncbi:MAG: DmsC/YnfH family molybdoenzyme membrane anchor subunit, partial [Gemmatimonadaceae bacterium]
AVIISMAQVYRLRTVPEWNNRVTTASFFATTLLLGAALHGALLEAGWGFALGTMGLIVVRLLVGWREPHSLQLVRAAAIIALLLTRFTSVGWFVSAALALIAEAVARRQFYAKREPRSEWRFAAPSTQLRK